MSAITSAHAPKSPLQKLRSATGSRRIFIHTVLIGVAIVMLYPLLWMLSSSFKPDTQIFTQPGLIPSSVRPENYSEGWSGSGNSFSSTSPTR